MATNTKFTPRTKHIRLKYHHIHSWVDKKLIDIIHVDTKEQFADMLTKPLDLQSFEKFWYHKWMVKLHCCGGVMKLVNQQQNYNILSISNRNLIEF